MTRQTIRRIVEMRSDDAYRAHQRWADRPMAAAKKSPASGGPGAGQAACGWPRRSKLEARDFPYVAPPATLAPIDKNAEPNRVPCGRAGRPPAGWINRPVWVEKRNGPAFDLERIPSRSLASPRPTERIGLRISYPRRCCKGKRAVGDMTGKGNGIGNPHGAGSPEEKTAGDASREYSPEAPQVGGFGGYQAMLDQGVAPESSLYPRQRSACP